MKRKIAAVDVGTTKICTIMGSLSNSLDLRISGVGIAPSRGIEKGLVANVALATESILESIKKAEKMTGHKLDSAVVGVNGNHINPLNEKGIVATNKSDQIVRPDDLKYVLAVALDVKTPFDRRSQVAVSQTQAQSKYETRNSVATRECNLDIESQATAKAIASVKNLTRCIQEANIDIEDLIMEPLANAEAVLNKEEKQTGVLIANIGGGTTDIAVIKEGSIYHSSVLPVAGNQITTDVAAGLGISFSVAEDLKKKYGKILFSQMEDDKDITLADRSVPYRDLCDIVSIRIEEIMRLVMLRMPGPDLAKLIPCGIVLTGGSANIPGIAEMTRAITRLPVRIGTPPALKGVCNAVLNDPAYATSVGLVLSNMKKHALPRQSAGTRNIFAKLSGLISG
jgi:cell division protein FtsA